MIIDEIEYILRNGRTVTQPELEKIKQRIRRN